MGKKQKGKEITRKNKAVPSGSVLFYVYILECADGTLYCGSTNNLEKRFHQHNHAKSGAHYTKIRRPVTLKWSEVHSTLATARAREAEMKRMTREEKVVVIKGS